MPDFELTPNGLSTQTQEEITEGLVSRLRARFGNNLDVSSESIMGQLVNEVSEMVALNQQVALSVHRSFDPNAALGTALDARAALTGSIRNGETRSTVSGILTFSGAGAAPNLSIVHNDDTDTDWELIDGPIGPGPGAFSATLAAVDPGPLLAAAGTPWSLVTAVPGLDGFTNPSDDANPGRVQELDPPFRVRRHVELFSQNVGGLAAIAAVVSRVDGVVTVRVYHNPRTAPADSDGIPWKAFNVVVETNPTVPTVAMRQAIADAIFSTLGAGGWAYGTDYTENVTDSEDTVHLVGFDVISLADVFINITLSTVGTEERVSENLAEVVAAQVLEVANLSFSGIGADTLEYKIQGIISDLAKNGKITGVVTSTVELSAVALVGPFIDPVPISIRQRADFDSINVQVAVVS